MQIKSDLRAVLFTLIFIGMYFEFIMPYIYYDNTSFVPSADPTTSQHRQKWAVIALAIPEDLQHDPYAFDIPFTVAAWKRIGWDTLIVLCGDIKVWKEQGTLVETTTLAVNPQAKFVVVDTPAAQRISYSQVVRSYVSIFNDFIQPEDLIMTSDADILPISRKMYDLVDPTSINILNADCCGTFTWKKTKGIFMQPMTNIAATKAVWMQFMDFDKTNLTTAQVAPYIQTWLEKHFGTVIAETQVQKGGSAAWYLDQHSVSVQIHLHYELPMKKFRRRPRKDRIDRAYKNTWPTRLNDAQLYAKTDVHLYHPVYDPKTWGETANLTTRLFTPQTTATLFQYYRTFTGQ